MGNCTKEGELASAKESLKSLHKRIDYIEEISDTFRNLTTSVAVMAEQMQVTNKTLEKLTNDVESLKCEDNENYKIYKRQVITTVLSIIAGAIVGTYIK